MAKVALGFLALIFLVRYLQVYRGLPILLLIVALFAVLAIWHERVLVQIRSLNALIAYYRRGIDRLEDRWAGTGETGERFIQESHPYARDIDVFGTGSLFELLCVVRTRAGEETLARWLLNPAPPAEILARQSASRDLQPRIAFREKLFTAGEAVRLSVRPDALVSWGEGEQSLPSKSTAFLALGLAALWIAGLVYGIAFESFSAFILISALNILFRRNFKRQVLLSVEAVEDATKDLDVLAQVLLILEQEHFTSSRLCDLQAQLKTDGIPPSAAVKKLDRITDYAAHHHNLFFVFLDNFIFYSLFCALWAESWRKKFGRALRSWLNTVGQMESLAALSGYAFEHPQNVWPEFVEGPACFHAEALAHPLLPSGKAVCNDFKLGDGLQLVVLSGPNMAGKSTFVRAIGVNAVLAQCGAPVRAGRLRMTPLAVGASICILDSLQGGISHFYAEIRRLKLISDLSKGPIPLLFLLDELLSGTNSHDRFEGTQLVIRSLLQHNAIGLVTTHDLALARIPETLGDRARNDHFEDHFENGKLAFDFKLKPGIVQTSNALRLMESIGLLPFDPPVSDAAPPNTGNNNG